MHPRIQNDKLVGTLLKHLKGKQAVSVNFTFRGDYVNLQSSADFIFDSLVLGDIPKEWDNKSISMMITNSIQLLDQESDGYTEIIDNGGVVIFEQDSRALPFVASYDERIEVDWQSISDIGRVSSSVLRDIASSFRGLLNTSKVLDIGASPVVINTGKVYCFYHDTVLIKDVPIVFPNMEISYNTFSNMSKNIVSSEIDIKTNERSKVIVIQDGNVGLLSAVYKKPNLASIESINERLANLTQIGVCSLEDIQSLTNLIKCFPKESLTLSIFEDMSIGISLTIVGLNTFNAGFKDLPKIGNIVLSTAQFNAILSTFKNVSSISVSMGEDLICLSTRNMMLLLSGMRF